MLRRLLLCGCFGVGAVFVLIQFTLPSPSRQPEIFYRFEKIPVNLNISGPTVNNILDEVSWLEDLSTLDQVCMANGTFILAVVPSAVHHFVERQRIRDTWANPDFYPYTRTRTLFVLGATTNTTLQRNVQDEMDAHHDIIQNDFIDSYRNLTYKSISWLSWVRDWCQDTPFVVKIDDDVVVNPFHLFQYLKNQIEIYPSVKDIHGRVRATAKPMRAGKWAVTEEEYSKPTYPPFVLGPAYILGRNCVDRLLAHTYYIPPLWLEDVYITGLVARAAGVKLIQAEKVLYTRKLTRRLYSGKVAFFIGASEKNRNYAWKGIIRYSPVKRSRKKRKR
ncbi:beta-1,3-galactosyltransferase 5-like isoform X2 [Panulirus ornatus]